MTFFYHLLKPKPSLRRHKIMAFVLHSLSRPWILRSILSRSLSTSFTESSHGSVKDFMECSDPNVAEIFSEDMLVLPDFLTKDEEDSLLVEVEKRMKRMRYEFDHWDNAIHGYRETEKKDWNEANAQTINRVKTLAFSQQDSPLAYIHILDLAKDGYIKPHVDAVRFCGDTITGMSLMSSCVMRLVMESDKEMFGNIYLPQRSLYIMKNRARYDFTHEVLKEEESFFCGNHIPRNRRISVVCRNEPRSEDTL